MAKPAPVEDDPEEGGEGEAFFQYSRDNYKRCPWFSYLVVAVVSGIIFFMACSPETLAEEDADQLALSIFFLVLGVVLLVPSFVGIVFVISYFICMGLCGRCPECCMPVVRYFQQKEHDVKPQPEAERPLSQCSRRTESVTIWTVENQAADNATRSATSGQQKAPITTQPSVNRMNYNNSFEVADEEGPSDEESVQMQVIVEGNRYPPAGRSSLRSSSRSSRHALAKHGPPPSEQKEDEHYDNHQMSQTNGVASSSPRAKQLWKDKEGNLVLHI